MKKVVVHPERCLGCMQCMVACAQAHSRSKDLLGALLEKPRPRPRVHVGPGPADEGFPNRCRHCQPAPCLPACLPGAIYREDRLETILIDPDKCINCASCAMACPFGVLRFHEDAGAPAGKVTAIKCDNCIDRQALGQIPACVEICKVGALTFETMDEAMKRQTGMVSRSVWAEAESGLQGTSLGFNLLGTMKQASHDLARR
ncbi:MAG: 4Fe-4S binding protein [Deltaproteobacteria bacterium]|nr:4Fe-4S binding protein [Deltaproteobacteria bacterium]